MKIKTTYVTPVVKVANPRFIEFTEFETILYSKQSPRSINDMTDEEKKILLDILVGNRTSVNNDDLNDTEKANLISTLRKHE